MSLLDPDWRVLDGVPTAWFDAPSLAEGADLAGRILELTSSCALDVRSGGVRVRLDPGASAAAEVISATARRLGSTSDPSRLQQLRVVVESPDPAALQPFWQRALGYVRQPDGGLTDPLRRDPAIRLVRSRDRRPLRNRVHLDVVRPAAAVDQTDVGEASGPYGVRHADADGNEIDLVPGDPLGDGPDTADWRAVFSAVAVYRTASTEQQRALVAAAAARADAAGFPLLIDVRPWAVVLDSGKDLWEPDPSGSQVDFAALARDLQAAARELGAVADPAAARFVQLFLDAADVAAVRAFWAGALGYATDKRPGVTDLYDPRRLGPEFVFQPLDAGDTERRRQRNRILVELVVPGDAVRTRTDTALAAGGTLVAESAGRRHVTDPEGNDLVIASDEA